MPRLLRGSRPSVFIVFIALVLVSVSLLAPHHYEPLNSISSIVYPANFFPSNPPTTYFNDIEPHPLNTPSSVLPPPRHENATFFMLTSNSESDITGAVQSVHELEDRFNHKYNYPWIFLNDEPFSDEFKSRISHLVSGSVHFAQIPPADWNQPPFLNATKVTERMQIMDLEGIPRSGSVSYHNMCRFNAGFFYRHPLLQNFKYAWRVEPDVHFHCDIKFDPFTFLRENNKIYGFNIAMYDYRPTVASLWSVVKEFMAQHPEYLARNNAMDFVSDDGGADYNLCGFYNNFEIADMDFWRGEAFSAFFDYLDYNGGFYYERWGDANVHTIGVALLAGKDQIHFFNEIGYKHYESTHCPTGDVWREGRCTCDPNPAGIIDYTGISCLPKWNKLVGRE